jgi:GT2 family glycosyltransferase
MSHPVVSGISVVIPNYNGRGLLEEILPCLFEALKKTSLPFEVIISDDHSTDDSVLFLRTSYPEITVLVNEVNHGFSPTINKGIFSAKHSHILLLNSDVKLSPGYFLNQFRYFEKPDTFGVMGKIIGWDDEIVQDGGKYPSFHGLKIKTSGNYVPVENNSSQWLYSMYLSGANAFVDREKICSLGGFDELFAPFYVEDYELSIRAWRIGWKCYYDDSSVCRHKVSVTIKSKARKNYINKIYYRNKMYLHALHLPAGSLFIWHIQLFFECLANVLILRTYFLKAVFHYMRRLPAVFQRRKDFKSLASKPGRSLLSLKEVAKLVLNNISQVKTRPLSKR